LKRLKRRLKQWIFRLLGKDPEAVVVTFASGPPELVKRMFAEIRALVPDRRHFLVTREHAPDLRPYRIGQAAVLFTGEPEYRALRRQALRLAPTKILAYNRRLERHHLRLDIASLLFLRGVPLDRIFLRPWGNNHSVYPTAVREFEGRPFTPHRPRVGILSPYFPYPLSHGGAVRMYSLIREIAKQFDVVLFSFTDQKDTEVAPMLEFCARVYTIEKPRYREPRWASLVPPEVAEFRSPAMRDLVAAKRRELQLGALQVEYTTLAEYGGDILVEHDVTFALYRQILDREPTLSARWNHWRWSRFERLWIARYAHVVVMSEQDRLLLGAPNVTVIPNGVDLARFQPEHERPGERLLFIGSFRHFPNIVAFRFFYEEVWPTLKAKSLSTRFVVVAGPDPLLYWRERTGLLELPVDDRLELQGFVADVRPLYIEANIVLVPTLVSAGTNLKVLEALAMDRAVVSTTSGCAGLGLQHGESVWVADDPAAFAAGIRKLLDNHDLRRSIALAGKRHAEQNFDWGPLGQLQRTLLRKLIPDSIRLRPATPADLDAIEAIQAGAPESALWHREDYLSFDCRVATIGSAVAGFLVSREVAPREREILNLAVHRDYRRLGVATKLIQAELQSGAGDYFLEVRQSNAGARALYKSLGFREVGMRPGYYENPPESGIVMRIVS
jgi:ribosomal protein S18 acetylase RimI-like enzyme/glycosyltransferase involved in cell wall biosynthesis